MPYVRHYRDFFDSSDVVEWFEPKCRSVISIAPKGFRGVAERNGVRIGPSEWGSLCARSDRVEFLSENCGEIAIGFGFGISILGLLEVAAPAILLFGLGLAAQALAGKPKRRGLDRHDSEEVSGTRRFTGVQTSVGSGQPIPIIFGTVRAGGHIIESFSQVRFSGGFDRDEEDRGSGMVVGESNTAGKDSQVAVGAETLNTRLVYCHGPVESISEVRIDGNPVENISGVTYELNYGSKVFDVTPLGFDERKDSRATDEPVSKDDGPVTIRTSQPVKSVEIGITFPLGLYTVSSRGSLHGRKCKFKVEYKESSAVSYVELETIEVYAWTRNAVEVWIRLTHAFADDEILDLRITRITDDQTNSTTIEDRFVWSRLIEVRRGLRAHPGVSQVAFRQVPQEQAPAPRDYTAKISGLNDIRVYSDESTYTEEFTNNPAWCFLRWLTDDDFGPGRYYSYEDNVDLPAFIEWAQFCDESVPDGRGGYETRCEIDIELRNTTPSARIIEIFSQAGDADIVNQGGIWTVLPQRDTPVMKQLDEGTYKKDSLSVSYLSLDERPAAITGTFLNRERDFKNDAITQVDRELSARYQSIPPEKINLVGITRPGQIQRTINARLNFSRIADETIAAEFGLSAIGLKVGDVVKLSTATAAHGILSGAILATNQIEITLDKFFKMESSKSYEISIPNGNAVDVMRLVSPDEDETTSIVQVMDVKWTNPIFPGMTYAIGELQKSTELFRVSSKTLNRQYNSNMTLHKYDPKMFDVEIDVDPVEEFSTVADNRLQPQEARNVSAVQRDIGSIKNIDVLWSPPYGANIAGYRILIREKSELDDEGNKKNFFFSQIGFTDGVGWLIRDVDAGTYEIRVDTLSRNGSSQPSEIAEITVI